MLDLTLPFFDLLLKYEFYGKQKGGKMSCYAGITIDPERRKEEHKANYPNLYEGGGYNRVSLVGRWLKRGKMNRLNVIEKAEGESLITPVLLGMAINFTTN